MRKRNQLILVALAVAAVLVGLAPAEAAIQLRTPQVSIGGNEAPTLQSVFDGIFYRPGALQAYGDQVGNAMFGFKEPTTATMIIEVAGFYNQNIFGMYDVVADPQNPGQDIIRRVEIFRGTAAIGATQTITYNAGQGVTLDGGVTWSPMSDTFGFYLRSPDDGGVFFYTQDILNPQGNAHALVYTGDGRGNNLLMNPGYTVNGTVLDPDDTFHFDKDFIFAWEDKKAGDWDFQDMVVYVSGITGSKVGQNPVPEPTALLVWSVLAGGGCGLAAARRRKGWSDQNRQAIRDIFRG